MGDTCVREASTQGIVKNGIAWYDSNSLMDIIFVHFANAVDLLIIILVFDKCDNFKKHLEV